MTNRDDMVIAPRLKRREETGPRERAQEERRTERTMLGRRRRMRRLRRLAAARRAMRRAVPSSKGRGFRGTVRHAAKGATRVLGAAAIAAELLILAGQATRAVEHGMSGRLIEAQDADTIYGDLDEQFTASAHTMSFFESRPELLRAIGRKGRMSAGLQRVAEDLRTMALRGARGDDILERDAAFDSADTKIAMMVRKGREMAQESGLADKAAEAMRLLRRYILFGGKWWWK